jgi:hypothetical protein
MAKSVFRYGRNNTVNDISISTEGLEAARKELLDAGDYTVTVVTAKFPEQQKRSNPNKSIILEAREIESEKMIDMRPMWVSGPNEVAGGLTTRNLGIIMDMLEAIGVPKGSNVDAKVLTKLVGVTFDVHLGLERGRDGRSYNAFEAVYGTVENDEAHDRGDVVNLRDAG